LLSSKRGEIQQNLKAKIGMHRFEWEVCFELIDPFQT